eukprot:256312_1
MWTSDLRRSHTECYELSASSLEHPFGRGPQNPVSLNVFYADGESQVSGPEANPESSSGDHIRLDTDTLGSVFSSFWQNQRTSCFLTKNIRNHDRPREISNQLKHFVWLICGDVVTLYFSNYYPL